MENMGRGWVLLFSEISREPPYCPVLECDCFSGLGGGIAPTKAFSNYDFPLKQVCLTLGKASASKT